MDGGYSVLDDCLKDILTCIKPSQNDNLKFAAALEELKTVIQSISTRATVSPFGSYVENLHTKWSDLDISVDGLGSETYVMQGDKQKALRLVKGALERSGIARNIIFIPQARVPVLSYESMRYNVSCDVTIDNHVAQIKSKIFKKMNDMDSRFGDLFLLVKEWAKVHDINDPKSRTLSSYALSLLVICYLQVDRPPILPPLSDIYERKLHSDILQACTTAHKSWPKCAMEQRLLENCDKSLADFKSYRSKNESTISQLLRFFFSWIARGDALSKDYVISTFNGQLKRESIPGFSHYWFYLNIQDPFDHTQNTAGGVRYAEFTQISRAFKKTFDKLSSQNILSNRDSLLELFARPALYSQLMAQRNNGNLNNRGETSNRWTE